MLRGDVQSCVCLLLLLLSAGWYCRMPSSVAQRDPLLLCVDESCLAVVSTSSFCSAVRRMALHCSLLPVDANGRSSCSKLRSIVWNVSPLFNVAQTGWPILRSAPQYCAKLPCAVKLARRPSTLFNLYHDCSQIVSFVHCDFMLFGINQLISGLIICVHNCQMAPRTSQIGELWCGDRRAAASLVGWGATQA